MFVETRFFSKNKYTATPQLNPEKLTKKRREVIENKSEIIANDYVYEFTPSFIDKKSKDLSESRLIARERRNLVQGTKFDVVAKKLTNKEILEEITSGNDTNREPVVVVSLNHFFFVLEHFFEITKFFFLRD